MHHTYATFGLMNGVNPAFMASQLGHSIEEFFKTYAKWVNGQQDDLQIGLIERAINYQKSEPTTHEEIDE
jgi:integrase